MKKSDLVISVPYSQIFQIAHPFKQFQMFVCIFFDKNYEPQTNTIDEKRVAIFGGFVEALIYCNLNVNNRGDTKSEEAFDTHMCSN